MSAFSLQRILPVLLASALVCGSVCAQKGLSKEESEELDSLLFRYDMAREEIQQKQWVEPMEKLRSGYREGMQKVQDRLSQTGDLTNALAARVAAKTDPTTATIHPDVKEIAEVQKVFIEAQKKLQTRLDDSLVKLARSHVAQLSTIKDGMIKVGRLDSALVVERIVHEFHAETMLLSSATVRSFEDKFGRVMVAELVSHTGMDADTVKIEKGGKKIDVRIDAFSEKDQQFIRDWMKRTPPKLNISLKNPRPQLNLKPKSDEQYLWKVVTIDHVGQVGGGASLAFSPSGHPAISYRDSTNEDLKYASFDGQKWTLQTIDSKGDVGGYTSLAFSPSGHPAISYYDYTNKDLKCASFDGRKWSTATIDSEGDVGRQSSLAFIPSGHPAISYLDYTNRNLKFASFDGQDWTKQTIDSAGDDGGGRTSLAFSPAGHPAISYRNVTKKDLKYASFDGRKWTKQTIASAGDVGRRSSLAFSPSGHPAISYRDNTDRGLKYASFDGRKWTKKTIDSGGVGTHTSLSFDPSGNPAISYYDIINKDLKYASFDGQKWTLQTIDSKGDVGGYTSLAFSPSGHPAISYYDLGNKDLKYTHRVIVKK